MAQERSAKLTTGLKAQQVMMTLSGIASTAGAPRPSGESVEQQTARIKRGIEQQLALTSLATAGQWALTWVGLTSDQANMAYIAQNTTTREYAVVFRGTTTFIDILEDNDVGTLEAFAGGPYGNVSRGSNAAFKELAKGTNLLSELQTLLQGAGTPTLYVVGHSLGGALATMFSLYLGDQLTNCNLQAYTFAAPTAGDKAFADAFNGQKNAPVCIWNQYDVVPNAWANLKAVEGFFPKPGPAATASIKGQIEKGISAANGRYVQTAQQPALNQDYAVYSPDYLSTTDDDWKGQLGFQHAANTYLRLLGLSQQQFLPDGPVVTSLTPSSGKQGTSVTITGKNFSSDCVVDFCAPLKAMPAPSVTFNSDTSLTCTAPPGILVVDVRVTNTLGTSGQAKSDHFTYLL